MRQDQVTTTRNKSFISILERKPEKKARKHSVCQSRESRGIFDETETWKMGPRQDQSRGLESRLQALLGTKPDVKPNLILYLTM